MAFGMVIDMTNQQPEALQQGYDAARLEIDHLRGAAQSKLLAQPVAWLVYLPSIDTQHLYYSQEDMGYVDDVTNHADAEVTPLYEMAAPKAEVAPAGESEPTDNALDTVLCNQWPAFATQATLVRKWVRAAMRDAIAKWGQPTPPAVVEPTRSGRLE